MHMSMANRGRLGRKSACWPVPSRAPEPAAEELLERPALARPGGSMAGGGPCREGGPGGARPPRRGLAAGAGRWGGGELTSGEGAEASVRSWSDVIDLEKEK